MVGSKDIWSPSGHSNFELFANKLPEQGTLLEIGSCVGKSTVAWAEAFEKQNKKWLKQLNYKIHKYPKVKNKTYDASYKPQTQIKMF